MALMKPICLWAGVLLTLLLGSPAGAQNYSISSSVFAGGGGVSTGGQYSLAGTIGQPVAGLALAGGNFSLADGFWSFVSVLPVIGAPFLTVTHFGDEVIVSWPTPPAGGTLLQSSNLTGGWTPSGFFVSTTNGTSSITISTPVGNLFFRLSQP